MRISLIFTLVSTAAAFPIAKKLDNKPGGLNLNAGLYGTFHVGLDGTSWHPIHADGKWDPSHSVAPAPGYKGNAKPGGTVNIPPGAGWGNPASSNPAPYNPTALNPAPYNAPGPSWSPPPATNAGGWTPPPATYNTGRNGPPPTTYNSGKQSGWY